MGWARGEARGTSESHTGGAFIFGEDKELSLVQTYCIISCLFSLWFLFSLRACRIYDQIPLRIFCGLVLGEGVILFLSLVTPGRLKLILLLTVIFHRGHRLGVSRS